MCCSGRKSPPPLPISALETNGPRGRTKSEPRGEGSAVRGGPILLLLSEEAAPSACGEGPGSSPTVTATLTRPEPRRICSGSGHRLALASRCSVYVVKGPSLSYSRGGGASNAGGLNPCAGCPRPRTAIPTLAMPCLYLKPAPALGLFIPWFVLWSFLAWPAPPPGQFLSQIAAQPTSLCGDVSLSAPRARQGGLQACGVGHMQYVRRGAKGSPGGEWWGNLCSSPSGLMAPLHPLLWGLLMLP